MADFKAWPRFPFQRPAGGERPTGTGPGLRTRGMVWLALILGAAPLGGVLIGVVLRLSREDPGRGAAPGVAVREDGARPLAGASLSETDDEEEDGDRADEPLEAARYMVELQQGGTDESVPPGVLGKAFEQVEAMRLAVPVAAHRPAPGESMEALVALQSAETPEGVSYFAGGMPVGPLPRSVPKVQPAAPAVEEAAPAPADPMAGAIHLELENLPPPPAAAAPPAAPRPAPRAPGDAAAAPAPELVLVGGVELYRSIDGGVTLDPITEWSRYPISSPHADQHLVITHPDYNSATNRRTVLVCGDGGVYRADDVRTADSTAGWKSLNNKLGITQFYAAAVSLATRRILAGAQDNGTVLYTPPPGPNTTLDWHQTRKGDGGFCAYDQLDPRLAYFEYIYAEVFRSITGGECTTDAITGPSTHSGVTEVGKGRAPFVAPFLLDPADPRIMLLGSRSVYRTMDVRSAEPQFLVIKPPFGDTFVSAIAARRLDQTHGPSDYIWVGHSDGAIFRTSAGDQDNPTWDEINVPASPLPKRRRCTRIILDPRDDQRVFACFGGYFPNNLWRSANGGANWEPLGQANAQAGPDVLKNLPDVSVYDLAIHPVVTYAS